MLTLLLLSCNSHRDKHKYHLKPSAQKKTFILGNRTKSSTLSAFIYEDKSGITYFTFQNQGKNEILFYDINKEELCFNIKPEVSGNNGVGFFLGYYIHNLDSIFLTTQGLEEIVLINKDAIIKEKIPYFQTDDNINLKHFYSVSSRYHPLLLLNKNLYIMPGCNRWAKKNPICATINTNNKSIQSLPFNYPSFLGADNKNKRASAEEYVSRCYDGNHFIYSFYFDEDIYVTDLSHEKVDKVNVKSKYIDKVKMLNDYGMLTHEDICENPNYGNLIFDKYRKVYYRIAYPQTKLEKGVRGIDVIDYGRKLFSIIILNEKFEIIGETLFPEYTYNSELLFVHKSGLYISKSHCMSPDYDDNVLNFEKLDLVAGEYYR